MIADLHKLSNQYPPFGYRKIYHRVRNAGWRVGQEMLRLLRRIYDLKVLRKSPKRRRPGTSTIYLVKADLAVHEWSYDFVAEQTADGKTLSVVARSARKSSRIGYRGFQV